MTVPVLATPAADCGLGPSRRRARLVDARRLGPAPTLDAAIAGLWARINARDAVACPLCQGEMKPEYGAGALPVAGRCRECGSVLS